ncbi:MULTISPECIES: BCCT family transporter [Micromonospora]|uniref:Choline/carnitine/betaine transport n=1 Tax=Micromonospora yangpuensis TaxID=683228 RepID=A0A1C6V408_9ACTN|nr:BCCT family transporter [Micromonospora yangpuensis]GGM15575.1 choline transporter [Micromonospora yangpuensis]SCL61083.1 choline/carnitine/betaine transport [Micromonospora yangpuensis]
MSESTETATPDAQPGVDRRPDPVLLALSIVGVLAVVAWGFLGRDSLASFGESGLNWVIDTFGWFFVIAANIFLVLAVVVAVSRFGRIRLGQDSDEPEFSNLAWIAMMFAGGMGIGLVFFAVAEPIQHYATPAPAAGVEPETGPAASAAMQWTLFHWTLHPWAIYAVVGLALAYSMFRKGRDNRISAAFHPLIGARADGPIGRGIDLLAVFATVFGTATSLGLGSLQIAAGLNLVVGVEESDVVELVIIAALTLAFVLSAFSGLHRGIKWLSTTNILLAVGLMLFVFVLGPTIYVLEVLPASIGDYLSNLVSMSTRTGAFSDQAWLGGWTIFYWAWWISWAPFVGTFIARISRGRTVRQFLIGVLLVPSGASTIWFAVMGGSALRAQATGSRDLVADAAEGSEQALFGLLESLPLAGVTSVLAMVLIGLYFVTSADSASLVVGSLTSHGALRPHRGVVVVWGVLIGAVAGSLLLAGGLDALQQATIMVALPFTLAMLCLAAAMVKEMSSDPAVNPPPSGVRRRGLPEAIGASRSYEEENAPPVRRYLRRRGN